MSAAHTAKPTPGPYVVNGFGGDFKVIARTEPHGVAISTLSERGDEFETARLLAAAPQLLEALKKVPRFLSMAEVCGKYESLEMNPTTLAKYRAELKTFLAELNAALAGAA